MPSPSSPSPGPAQLLLVRHGQTAWNRQGLVQGHTDEPLDDVGREQALRLGKRLAKAELDVLYSSDLSRASETAACVGVATGLSPRLSPAWREMCLGTAEGRPRQQAYGEHKDMASAAACATGPLAPGAETWEQVQGRVLPALDKLLRAHPGERVALVGHGGSLKVVLAHLLGLDRAMVPRLSVGGNTGLSVVEFYQGEPRLVLLNDTGHLR
ncbi:MAG: broad specificity phosphatase PhoE [Pseudohongiellaceae bacterium]|jgi:broad specificity phosphatase PhoE